MSESKRTMRRIIEERGIECERESVEKRKREIGR